jgi:hypothetical protein
MCGSKVITAGMATGMSGSVDGGLSLRVPEWFGFPVTGTGVRADIFGSRDTGGREKVDQEWDSAC